MRARGGVITRDEALQVVGRHIIDKTLRAGAIVRAFPTVYVLPELKHDERTVDRAAIAYVSGGALSHTTGLRSHGVSCEAINARRHITTAPGPYIRTTSELVVHRRHGFTPEFPHVVLRSGLPVVRLEHAIIESWPLLLPGEQRKPAITAVGGGLTTGARLINALEAAHRPTGASEMRELFRLLSLGCRSELEIWGHSRVFDTPGLGAVVLQHVVHTPAGTFVLDRAYLDALVGVELDGAAWHGSHAQRERDVRRDAALAAAGWLIVRFTHARLRKDPNGCRSELIAILDTRRRRQAQ